MELFIDLIHYRKKSTFTLVMGIISIALPFIYITNGLLGSKEFSAYMTPMMVYLALNGILGILQGLGYSWERFFGSAYVRVDDNQIALKTGVWKKVQAYNWDNIKSIHYKSNRFEIGSMDGTFSRLILSELEFKVLIETRNAIFQVAAQKGLFIQAPGAES